MHLGTRQNAYRILLILAIAFIAGCGSSPEDQTKLLAPTLKRAEAYADQGQYKAAVIEARNALRMAPESPEAIILASRINIDLGQSRSALELLSPLKESNDPTLRLLLSEAYLMRGKKRSALEYLKNTTGTTPEQKNQKLTLLFKANLLSSNFSDAASNLSELGSIASSTSDKANHAYLKSTLLFRQNKLDEAASTAQNSLDLEPNHTEALLIKAAISYRNQNLEQSETLLSDALLSLDDTDVLLPQKVKVLKALIDVLSAQGRSSEALIYTKLLAQNNPGATEQQSQLNEALELYREGKYDEAEKMLIDINNTAPNSRSKQLLGLLSLKKGNLVDAESYLSDGFDPEIANNQSLTLLARTRLGLRQPSKVIAMLKEEVKARENNSEILALYGLASLANGDEKEGVDALSKAISISPERHRLRIALADYYSSNNKPQLALKHLEEAYQKAPTSDSIQKRLLKHYLTEPTPTTPVFYSDLEAKPNDPQLNFLVGSLEYKKGNTLKARNLLLKALDADPKNSEATFSLAILSFSQRNYVDSEKYFLAAIELSPNNTKSFKGLADSILKQGNRDKLVPLMEKLESTYSTSTGPGEVLSELYMKQLDLDKALTHAKSAYAKNENSRSALSQLLKVYNYRSKKALGSKEYQNAREELMHALKITPNNTVLLAELINIEIAASNIPEAKKVLQQIASDENNSAIVNTLSSDIALKEGALEDALLFSEKAWNESKSTIVARKRYNILRQHNRANAELFLEEWINAKPNSAEPLKIKGSNLLTLGRYPAAISALERATKLTPNDPVSLNNLAWLYQEINDPRAINIAKKAHLLAPNNGGIADTYGWILVQNGQTTEGIEKLELALTLAPDNEEIQQHLAEAKNK